MLRALSGGPSLDLMSAPGFWPPQWSPDNEEILVSVRSPEGSVGGASIVSRLGGTPRPLPNIGAYACWTGDGSRVVSSGIHEGKGGGLDIMLVEKLTGAMKVTHVPGLVGFPTVFCTPTAEVLMIVTADGGKYQLWTIRSDGSQLRKVTEENKEIDSPKLSNSGDVIYYFRSEGDTSELVKISTSSERPNPVVLVSGLEAGDNFSISADNSLLSYTREQSSSNLWSVEIPPKFLEPSRIKRARLTSGNLNYQEPNISPDGRWIAYTNGSGLSQNIYKMPIVGGSSTQLTFFDRATARSPVWDPDGERIAFLCDQDGSTRVWMVSSTGGESSVLDKTNATGSNNHLAWFPSKQLIYQKPGLHNLARVDLASQTEESVLPRDSDRWLPNEPVVAPDGNEIADYWNRDDVGLWVLRQIPYSEKLIARGYYNPIGWSADGRYIYALDGFDKPEIFKIDSKASSKPILFAKMPGGVFSGAVSPDGTKMILTIVEEKSDVWIMRNFDPESKPYR